MVEAATTADARKGGDRVNKIAGFLVNKVDGAVMRAHVKQAGLDVDPAGTDEQLGVAITLHYGEVTKRDDLCECNRCKGVSPADLPACPLCGLVAPVKDEDDDAGEEDDEDDADPSPEAAPPAPPSTAKAARSPGRTEGGKPKKLAAATKINTATVGAEPPKEEAAMTTKTEGAAMTTKTEGAAAKNGVVERGLVKVNGKGAAMSKPLTVQTLDEAVFSFIELKTKGLEAYHALAKLARDINQRQLWKLRVDEKGKPRYSGFDAFAQHELHVSPAYAWDLINAARTFTPEDMHLMGKTKAILVLKAAPEDRERLKQEVIEGRKTKEELRKDVRESREKSGAASTQQAKAGKKSGESRKKKAAAKKPRSAGEPAQSRVTVAALEGRKTIKLFARPESLRNVDLKACKRAKSVKHLPFGIEEMTNEITVHYSVQETEAGLVLVIDRRRNAAPSAE